MSAPLSDVRERRLIELADRAHPGSREAMAEFLYFAGAQPACVLPHALGRTSRRLTSRVTRRAADSGWTMGRVDAGWQYWTARRARAGRARFKAYIAVADLEFAHAFPYLFQLITDSPSAVALKYPYWLMATHWRCDRLIAYFDSIEGKDEGIRGIAAGLRNMTAATVPFGGRTNHAGLFWGMDLQRSDAAVSWRRFVTTTIADALAYARESRRSFSFDVVAERLLEAGVDPATCTPGHRLLASQK